ncbi:MULTISPECIES: cysteine desulfurase family protein [unclassified Enterococcus]|uniref:cysteine desulfurase family protein n=1 Tax=unclassified Enterococcus TaxID=2608891 RepID=UPI0015525704|nr:MULTISPECIES: cysteine desulfurase family protein [unclassified Enterococcus]MBS7577024.1 cysteine desulfurase [Enterococcus sp. MMGLQ5-2]MBS7584529.1 cysteine desulfurase [Enterococcus sp. MMGLQ5-1]NPD12384.1 cysteine desulfurase [Enterococcus sp. MMGLQ5-1]NPD36858.1 cysteine desulfurase [Enterococcus sp. MMGLQ5-2]
MYFDYAATTPVLPEVAKTIGSVLADNYGNASSIHAYGRKAAAQLEQARTQIAQILEVRTDEIVFTSCGTESNNTALIGAALANQSKGKHLITTSVEHHSILHPMSFLERELGFEVTYLPVDANGQISLADLKAAIRLDTILVSIMMVNNETGNLYPISEIGDFLAEKSIIFHTDAVQAIGKIAVKPNQLKVDLLSATAHKFGGPKGVGFLYCKAGTKLNVFMHGGDQERKRRAGTENLAYIVGMTDALAISEANRLADYQSYESFKAMIFDELDASRVPYYINGSQAGVPYVLNIGFRGIKQDLLLMKLDLKGIAVSTGSACTAGAIEPSHVLEAMYGTDSEKLTENIRISFGKGTTCEAVKVLIATLIQETK